MNIIRKNFLPLFILFLLPGLVFSQEDIVLKAMSDEMQRSVLKLKFENLSRPYFVSYYVEDSTSYYSSASFGSIKNNDFSVSRQAKIEVRVGDKKFDSSNFISNFRNYKPIYSNLPIEDDYDAIRKSLWLLSDEAYKSALENYTQKDAYRKKKDIKEIYGDLTDEKPVNYVEDKFYFKPFDFDKYSKWLKKVSLIFRKYKYIQDSDLDLNYEIVTKRYVNSENFVYKTYSSKFSVSVYIQFQNETGYKINDSKSFVYNDFSSISLEQLERNIDEYAKKINDIYKSEKLDYYVGPAIFEDEASGEFFNQLFVQNISFNPKPWAEQEEWLKYYYDIPSLIERKGKRIFPAFISIYDDALESSFEGQDLIGYYKIDDEGIMPQKIDLVKKGKLINIYTCRIPDKDNIHSNGHGRGGIKGFISAGAANVFVKSEKSVPFKKMLENLINIGKEQELDYVVLIRKIKSYKDTEKMIGDPLLLYKIDVKTGEESPLDVSEFDGVGLRALRDILMTSEEYFVYNFYQKAPFVFSNSAYPVSLIIPKALLIQEIELKKTEKKTEKKPYMAHPYFEGRK